MIIRRTVPRAVRQSAAPGFSRGAEMNGTGHHLSLVVVGNLGEGDNKNFAKTDGGVHMILTRTARSYLSRLN